ncbi:Retrovirus-related Pol polyprotein from transposon TNT 1-94 [Araneus ventricosus]|uniref:Retrovirus-related Pol polyprotein from transposon TNT 1-94 n=1 Tax=Araneus ventricosus TaxID=182803 RepID=A0A4Y2K407_ARAVE|nr:Retrovirus-related Pol polyprotein from transposon TNT 1-94 [Araneus ventricosus]
MQREFFNGSIWMSRILWMFLVKNITRVKMRFVNEVITEVVSIVFETLDYPKVYNWNSVKRILKYLKGSSEYGLYYPSDNSAEQLKIYTDADYAGDSKTRRSRTGVVSKFANGAISWASQKQKSVVLSTTEAEYVITCEGAKECIWLSRLLSEIGATNDVPVFYVDNSSAVKLVKNSEYHKR